MIQGMLTIWSLVPLPFLNPACTSGSSQFTYCWNLAWRILSTALLACEMSTTVQYWTFFGIAFSWDWNENWPFPVLWPLLSFPNLMTYWVQHFTASSFMIWNSSTGIPSPPLALFAVMLPKAHLTLHSKMSGSGWLITPSWLSRSLRPFLYSSVYSCQLFYLLLLLGPYRFCPWLYPSLHEMFRWYLNILKRSPVLPFILFSSISLPCSLEKAFLSLLAILCNSAFRWVYLFFSPLPFASLLFSVICKASSDNHFALLHFFFLGMVLVTASYTMLWTSIPSSSGTLSIRSNPLKLFLTGDINLRFERQIYKAQRLDEITKGMSIEKIDQTIELWGISRQRG